MHKFKSTPRRESFDFDLQLFTLSATVSRNPDSIDTYDGTAPLGWPNSLNAVTNEGDILIWDSTNFGFRPPVTQADMATYVGIAESQSPTNSLGDIPTSIRYRRYGIVWMFATNGDSAYTPYTKLYFNETVSVQTVTSSTNAGARTIVVGYYYPSNQQIQRGGSANINFTPSAVGQLIPVWLTPNYPAIPNVYPAI